MGALRERGAQPTVDADDLHHRPLAGGDLDFLSGKAQPSTSEFEGALGWTPTVCVPFFTSGIGYVLAVACSADVTTEPLRV
ncbi:hypothetical protein [Streptomyces werraensis]|uniref:hypothetical protein n=1 Tax=Streptomyces werraensis TaxID=68284 RepID=UPI0037D92254